MIQCSKIGITKRVLLIYPAQDFHPYNQILHPIDSKVYFISNEGKLIQFNLHTLKSYSLPVSEVVELTSNEEELLALTKDGNVLLFKEEPTEMSQEFQSVPESNRSNGPQKLAPVRSASQLSNAPASAKEDTFEPSLFLGSSLHIKRKGYEWLKICDSGDHVLVYGINESSNKSLFVLLSRKSPPAEDSSHSPEPLSFFDQLTVSLPGVLQTIRPVSLRGYLHFVLLSGKSLTVLGVCNDRLKILQEDHSVHYHTCHGLYILPSTAESGNSSQNSLQNQNLSSAQTSFRVAVYGKFGYLKIIQAGFLDSGENSR